jgi:putative membrane protein
MRLLVSGIVLTLMLAAYAGVANAGLVTTPTDQEFASKTAGRSAGEVLLGELATSRGTNRSVTAFGKRMAADNHTASDELKSIAAQSGITLPGGISESEERTFQRLVMVAPDRFDFAYAAQMVTEHERELEAFQQELKDGKDPSLRAFAAKNLPKLQSQLDQARAMLNAVMFES